MYYAIGVSAPSLHRESTDSLIHIRHKLPLTYLTVTSTWAKSITPKICFCCREVEGTADPDSESFSFPSELPRQGTDTPGEEEGEEGVWEL